MRSYEFRTQCSPMTESGLPHSEISGSMRACRYPKLIAAYHVLHRLPMPRHPSCALSSLTTKKFKVAIHCKPVHFGRNRRELSRASLMKHFGSRFVFLCNCQRADFRNAKIHFISDSVPATSAAEAQSKLLFCLRRALIATHPPSMACQGEVRSTGSSGHARLRSEAAPWQSPFFAPLRTKPGGRTWTRTRDLVLIRDAL